MKIPGSRNLRLLLEVSRRSIRKYLSHNMTSYAAALAYHALFALVPFFALLVALLGFLGIGSFFEWLTDQTGSALIGQTAGVVEQWIKQSQYQAQGGLFSGVVIIAVWSV